MHHSEGPFVRSLSNGNFLTGLGIGAAVTLLVANPGVQRAVFRTVARAANMVTAGFTEAKERFHDAQAEVAIEGEETETA
jgi:hypothetical protein